MNRQQRRAAERARAKAASRADRSGDTSALVAAARRLLGEQRWSEAEQSARDALQHAPDDAAARAVLMTSLWRSGRLDEAMLEGRRLVRQCPEDPAAHETLGFVLFDQDRMPEALAAFEKAVGLAPDRWSAHVALGNSLGALGDLEQARVHHERAVALAPERSAAHNDLGQTLLRMGDYEAAAAAYLRAGSLTRGRSSLVEWNSSLALLGTGALADAWPRYAAGFATGARKPDRDPGPPHWEGEDLAGRTLLVWGEQGLGDEVRFASCVPDVLERADHVIVEAAARLVPLLARSFPGATVRAETFDRAAGRETTSFDEVDVQSPSGSLPRYVRQAVGAFPRTPGYLRADPGQRERWRERLDQLPSGLRVGLSWRSGNLDTSRLASYLTLEEITPALRTPGVTFVNLQYGSVALREEELDRAEAHTGTHVHRWQDLDYTDDIDAVAALTAELDLVVGPASFPTVLSGALGVPTCVLAPATPWTHGQSPRDPWFPATRHVVRGWDQPWGPAVDELATRLDTMARGGPPPHQQE